MSQDFIFELKDQYEFKMPFSVKLLGKLGDAISKKIFSGKYYVQSQVSRETFQTFLDYLYDKKENPELTVDNYYEFQLLSDEFNGILSEYLMKKEFEKIKILSILKSSRTEEKRDVSSCEEYIATNLDYFLENYRREMKEMRTTTLYNIFKHERRKLKNHERAYDFIKEVVKSGKDSDCVLLLTLDCNEMSEESIKEAFSNKEKNYGFLPEFNISFISDIKNQMNAIMMQQNQLMNIINSMLNEKINSIQDNNLLLSKKIEEISKKIENENTKSSIENLTEKVGNIESKVNETFTKSDENSREINDIKEKVELIKTKNSEITTKINEGNEKASEKIANMTQKIEESNNKINKKLENVSQKIEESNEKTDSISQKIGNIESKVNEIFTKSNENSREIKDIKEKVKLIKTSNSEITTKINEGNEKTSEKIANLTQKIEESNNKINNLSQKDIELLKISVNANNKQFNGIIRQLTNECGGNVSDKGIVNVTASSAWIGKPRNVVDLENAGNFGTNTVQDSWIKYNFKNKKVSPIFYLIRSCNWDKDKEHPKSWVVEGSNTDSNDWKVLDSRKDFMSLNNPSAVQYFAIQQSSDFYRFLRIRQTDVNCYGDYCFCMSALEYFGFIQ